MSSQRRRDRFRAQAERRAAKALRPFGYYFPQIQSTLLRADKQSWILNIAVTPGEPVKVRRLLLEVKGEGKDSGAIVEWKTNWPLIAGATLDQVTWDQQKESVLNRAGEQGYLSAVFETSKIELDLEQNFADLVLVLDTGPRAVMGDISYDQDNVRDSVLESLPRFNSGDYYRV